MLAGEQYINQFLRDHKTWKRAATQHSVGGDASALPADDLPWGLRRRGNSENAITLRFAHSLRSASLASPPTSLHMTTRWSSSTQPSPSDDLLRKRLQRNLRSRGVDAAFAQAEAARASSAHTAGKHNNNKSNNLTAHGVREAFERCCAEISSAEAAFRKDVATMERRTRRRVMVAHHSNLLAVIAVDEFHVRRDIFRAAITEHRQILAMERAAFEGMTGISHDGMKMMIALAQQESSRRNLIVNQEHNDATTIQKVLYVLNVEVVERLIASCARREARLLRQQ